MLREGEEQLMAWARDPLKSWNEFQLSLDKGLALDGGIVEKLNEDKLARDVDDLTAIFEDLADGADLALPVDDLETDAAAAAASAWIDSLEEDAVNVNELSAAFDALVDEQDAAMADESASEDCSEEDEDMDSEGDDYSDEDVDAFQPTKVVHSAPVWACMAPLDPRSCIRGPVFKNLDPRIPRIEIPRIDLSNAAGCGPAKAASVLSAAQAAQSISPKHGKEKAKATAEYRHDPKTCWICKSSKTPEKKRALHRYLEKRSRRNWKRGPRYAGRSHVATSRVRNGGRFICTTRWV